MALKKRLPLRPVFALLVFGIALVLLHGTLVSSGSVQQEVTALTLRDLDGKSLPALREKRQVFLSWPQKVLEKDTAQIDLGIRISPQQEQTVVSDAVETDIYATHNLVAVARLDLAGAEVARSEIQEPLLPGREVIFRWNICITKAGVYRGKVWLHLDLVPRDGAPVERVLLLARPIEVEAVTVFGLSAGLARWAGLAGIALGASIGYPFLRRLWKNQAAKRRRRSNDPEKEEKSKRKSTE